MPGEYAAAQKNYVDRPALQRVEPGYPDSPHERPNTLGDIANRSRSQNNRLDSYISGLEYLLARLHGPQTGSVAGSGLNSVPTQPSAVAEVEDTILQRAHLLDRLESVCVSLETLA